MNEKSRTRKLDKQFLHLYLQGNSKSPSRRNASLIKRGLEFSDGMWVCRLCGGGFKDITEVTIDHVIPQSHRSKNDRHIVQLAHSKCNSKRGNMPIDYFFMYRAFINKFPEHTKDSFSRLRKSRERSQKFALTKKSSCEKLVSTTKCDF